MKVRHGLIFLLIIFLGLLAYWFKSQREIDLFKHFHLRQYLPVQALEKHLKLIKRDKYLDKSILVKDVFEVYTPATSWSRIWAREKGFVKAGSALEGPDGSRCLKVESESSRNWALWSNIGIEVAPGDFFVLEGRVRVDGKAHAKLAVALNQAPKKVLKWIHGAAIAKPETGWQDLRSEFEIPEGAQSMRVGMSGSGIGTTRFDDVVLTCRKKS